MSAMTTDDEFCDLLLEALLQSLRRKRPDVAEHIVSALEELDRRDPADDGPRLMAYRIIARRG
jgi:hypothetical protein